MSAPASGRAGAGAGVAAARAWFFSGSWSAALAWGALVLALAAVLIWFFVFSPYGAPAAPVYAEF